MTEVEVGALQFNTLAIDLFPDVQTDESDGHVRRVFGIDDNFSIDHLERVNFSRCREETISFLAVDDFP